MNVPYHLCFRYGRFKRRLFTAWIRRGQGRGGKGLRRADRRIGVSWVGFSGRRDFPEQVASLISVLRWVGVPERIEIVSDGTHTPEMRRVLESVHPVVRVHEFDDFVDPGVSETVRRYAEREPMGKKLWMLMSIDPGRRWVYCDSDVLFFPGGRDFAEILTPGGPARYLVDCAYSLDGRMAAEASEVRGPDPVNGGLLVLPAGFDWTRARERIEWVANDPKFFSEQTAVHLSVKANAGVPLPPERYIMRNEDQWLCRDLYAHPEAVCRHYISSLRHKMWLRVKLPGR